jgi:hypothetical protein
MKPGRVIFQVAPTKSIVNEDESVRDVSGLTQITHTETSSLALGYSVILRSVSR